MKGTRALWKITDHRMGKEIYKMSLKNLLVPENKEVHTHTHHEEDISKEHGSQL